MNQARTFVIVAVTLAFGALFGGPGAKPAAVSDVASGVWWVGQPAGAPTIPPPAQVPAGGLWVSSNASGPVSLSAVRFTVGANDRQPIVSAPVAMNTSPPQTAAPVDVAIHILACATTGNWSPPASGSFGALSAAPAYDCTKGQVLGALSADGKQIDFDLGQFVTDTSKVISVVLVPQKVPAPVPAAPVAPPAGVPPLPEVMAWPTFDVTFNPVTSAAIDVVTSAAPVTEDDFGFNDASGPVFDSAPIELALGNPAPIPRRRGIAALPGQVARQLSAVKTDPQSAQRTVAGVAFVLLLAWAWTLNRDTVPGAAPGRPFRTLYDGDVPETRSRRAFGAITREGRPPPLR